jgi:hypothetical protein
MGKALAKDIESALDWCKIKEVKSSCVDENSPVFHKIARVIEGTLEWMQNKGVSPDDADRLLDCSQIESIPVARRTP